MSPRFSHAVSQRIGGDLLYRNLTAPDGHSLHMLVDIFRYVSLSDLHLLSAQYLTALPVVLA